MLAQKIMLETDEDKALQIANRTKSSFHLSPIYGAEQKAVHGRLEGVLDASPH